MWSGIEKAKDFRTLMADLFDYFRGKMGTKGGVVPRLHHHRKPHQQRSEPSQSSSVPTHSSGSNSESSAPGSMTTQGLPSRSNFEPQNKRRRVSNNSPVSNPPKTPINNNNNNGLPPPKFKTKEPHLNNNAEEEYNKCVMETQAALRSLSAEIVLNQDEQQHQQRPPSPTQESKVDPDANIECPSRSNSPSPTPVAPSQSPAAQEGTSKPIPSPSVTHQPPKSYVALDFNELVDDSNSGDLPMSMTSNGGGGETRAKSTCVPSMKEPPKSPNSLPYGTYFQMESSNGVHLQAASPHRPTTTTTFDFIESQNSPLTPKQYTILQPMTPVDHPRKVGLHEHSPRSESMSPATTPGGTLKGTQKNFLSLSLFTHSTNQEHTPTFFAPFTHMEHSLLYAFQNNAHPFIDEFLSQRNDFQSIFYTRSLLQRMLLHYI